MVKPKKTPLRKCAGCQEMKDKKQLIRVVRSEEGVYSLDTSGKKPGRGAYVCPNARCFAKARKSKGFERSFKGAVPMEVYDALERELINDG